VAPVPDRPSGRFENDRKPGQAVNSKTSGAARRR
jgi:hypothetical protein